MPDLLEDPDGAPYPQEVQDLLGYLETADIGHAPYTREKIIEALEAVAKANKPDPARVYATLVRMHERGVSCGDLLGSRTLAEELADA